MLAVAKGRERVRAAARVQRGACYRAISSRNETQVQPMEAHPPSEEGDGEAAKQSGDAAELQDGGALNASLCPRWRIITY